MKITSSAFSEGQLIPTAYTQHGQDSSPPLAITEVPKNAKSIALIVDDPDAPKGTFTHWILFNLDPHVGVIIDNSIPPGALEGKNSTGRNEYVGPKPPSGIHRYFFRAYALDRRLPLSEGASRYEVERAMNGFVLAEAQLVGRYSAEAENVNAPR